MKNTPAPAAPVKIPARAARYLAAERAARAADEDERAARAAFHDALTPAMRGREGLPAAVEQLRADYDAARAAGVAAKKDRDAALAAVRWIYAPGNKPGAGRVQMEGVAQGVYYPLYTLPRVTPAALAAMLKDGVPDTAGRELPREELYAVILFKGAQAGRIVVQYPRDGAGTLYMRVAFCAGPFKSLPVSTGSAGGYGYDKLSAAFGDALCKAGIYAPFSGEGMGAVGNFLSANSYTLAR